MPLQRSRSGYEMTTHWVYPRGAPQSKNCSHIRSAVELCMFTCENIGTESGEDEERLLLPDILCAKRTTESNEPLLFVVDLNNSLLCNGEKPIYLWRFHNLWLL